MNSTPTPRRPGATRRLRAAALAAALALGLAALPAAAAGTIDAIVVRYADAAVSPQATDLPATQYARLAEALGATFSVTGRTPDGGFVVTFPRSIDVDAVRAALNKLRLDPATLYANVAPGAPVRDATGRPTDRIVVKYRDPVLTDLARSGYPLDSTRVARVAADAGQAVTWLRGTHDGANVLRMFQRLPIGDVEDIAARIAQDPGVEYAVADRIRTAQVVPTDPCYASASVAACNGGYQWDLFDPVGGIAMPAAWDITTGSAGIRVAVLDTGALPNHPDLVGRFVGGYDMIAECATANDGQPVACAWASQTPAMTSRESDASDAGDWITSAEAAGLGSSAPPYDWFKGCPVDTSSWHGTHVAGTIGAIANNGIGITGINWVSPIVPVRVLGKCGGYDSDINDAMVWAAGGSVSGVPANANPARVISLSLGGGGSCDAAQQSAINTALGLGAVVVVAAGNSNQNAANFSPASCSGVITVAATTQFGLRARYSNYGSLVEIAAPGGNAASGQLDILSTLNSGTTSPAGYNYVQYAGTSMATPHVSGVASLMLSANPSLTPAQVLSKIQTTARVFPTTGSACANPPTNTACNCTTSLCGSGILNAAAAVASAAGTGPAATTTTLGSSPNPSTSGASVTFTATVSGTNPTGTVNFRDGANSVAGCGAVALTGTGNSRTAQCATSALTVATHSMTAVYGGDAGNATSTSAVLSQVVNPASGPVATTTTLASSANPSNAGQSVTFTASVTGNAPTGTVNFKDGASSIANCSAVAIVGGAFGGGGNTRTAKCTTNVLASGSHSVTAVYAGDAGNQTSTSAVLSQVVNGSGPAATTTTLGSAPNPSTVGQNVVFTATVNGTNPTGTVNFKDGANSISGCAAAAVTSSGNSRIAQCTTGALTQGTHSITAVYGGDAGNATSTSAALSQVVNAAGGPVATSTTIVSSLNPSTVGASVKFTATVNGANPTGAVDFRDGAASIAGCAAIAVTGTGNSRTAACTTTGLTAGAHSVTANYGGDAGNQASASAPLSQVVNTCVPSPRKPC
jgi:serine protease